MEIKRVKWLLFRRVKSVKTTLTKWKITLKRVNFTFLGAHRGTVWKKNCPSVSFPKEWNSLFWSDFHLRVIFIPIFISFHFSLFWRLKRASQFLTLMAAQSFQSEWKSQQKSACISLFGGKLTEGQFKTKELSLSELPNRVKFTLWLESDYHYKWFLHFSPFWSIKIDTSPLLKS